MQAGIARTGRTFLAALSAAVMVFSLMFVFASPADADHIDATGPVQGNCVEFQGGNVKETGSKSPMEFSHVTITLDSWDDLDSEGEPHAVTFTIAGLDTDEHVDISLKSGTDEDELGPFGNGQHSVDGPSEHAISHIRLCVFVEETTTTTTAPTTTTTVDDTTTTTVEDTTTTTVEDTTTTTAPEEVGEIVVQKVVLNGSNTFEFTFDTVGFTLADNTLADGQASSSGDVAVGDGYAVSEQVPPGWTLVSATCDDGSPVTNIDVAAGETVTCTFTNTIEDEVQASILVQVEGSCVETDGEGEGVIDVTVSVDGGAEVVVRDADNDVLGTFTSDGSVTVPEGATYTWEATANEGFEFPEGAETSGSITIETCSDPETLPFTGIDTDLMAAYAAALVAGGLTLLGLSRRTEES